MPTVSITVRPDGFESTEYIAASCQIIRTRFLLGTFSYLVNLNNSFFRYEIAIIGNIVTS